MAHLRPSAQRGIFASLMADAQATCDRHVLACQGRPWSTSMAVVRKGWRLTDLPQTSTPAPTADEEGKYKEYRCANQGYEDGQDDPVSPAYWDNFTEWLYEKLGPQPQPQRDHSDFQMAV